MFALPGFDPKGMTDDELAARTADLTRKLAYAERSAAGQGSQQLAAMLAMLVAENNERQFMRHWRETEALASEPIETDPGLRDAARAARDRLKPPQEVRPGAAGRPRRSYPMPTPHPVAPAASAPAPARPGGLPDRTAVDGGSTPRSPRDPAEKDTP